MEWYKFEDIGEYEVKQELFFSYVFRKDCRQAK